METLPAIPILVPIPTTLEETQPPAPKQDIVFRSRLPDIDIPSHLPLHSYIFENISKFSERPCLIEGATGKVYTYADVEVTSRKVASSLSKLGISHGDTIMLLLPNMAEFVFAFFGASYLGAISTMANPLFTSAQIIKQAKDSNAKIIITLACHVDKVGEFASENELKVICVDTAPEGCLHYSELIHGDENEFSQEVIKILPEEDVVALPYTSGTTGIPKGVMFTHKVVVTNVAQQVDGENANMYMHNEDVLMCVMPFYHMFALSSILFCGLRVGAAILIMQKFEIVPFLEMIEKYKVTVGSFVPPVVLAIAKSNEVDKYDLSSVRMMMLGAAPLGKELEDNVRTKLPNAKLGQGYGMTEGGPVIAMSLALAKEPFKIKSGACGTVVRNAEMKIVDVHTGESLPRNQRGEVCMRGNNIMKGYLNNPEATARAIDKEGWLHSGDIGFIDDDDELFIVDRMIELIKYKGFQVAPAELEALLLTHPNISDAAVVSMIDEEAGEVPVAFVVITNGSTITEDEIKHFISKQVVFYKRINRVFFMDAIPKVASGKILRRDLRERLAAMISK